MNPLDMKSEQSRLSKWFEQKADIIRHDADELKKTLDAAYEQGFRLAPSIERQHKIALKRVDFYEKCKAAIDAGYALVPNFPVQAFAIRTTKKSPTAQPSKWPNDTRQQESNAPKLGEGSYYDAVPISNYKTTRNEKNYQGEFEPVDYFHATDFDPEIEFPISVAKPAIMSATSQAMALKCFDEIGVLPNRHVVKRDPIVVGIIRDPRSSKYSKRVLTFLIAWTVDTADL